MTDEDWVTTSEIAALLNHKSTAATRSWIRNQGLKAIDFRDGKTGERLYRRSDVEEKIAAMPRGPYTKTRPPTEGPTDDHDGRDLPD